MPNPLIENEAYAAMDRIYTRPGGHVEVYKGEVDGAEAIIKIASEESAVKSLQHEANVLKKLQDSQHAPALYEIGYSERNQKHFLAMEFIEGDPLSKMIALGKEWVIDPLSPTAAFDLLKKVADAEKDLLAHDILYRDFNLDHLILKEDEQIAFIDFGSASTEPQLDSEGGKEWRVIDDGRNGGTWEFMAPEEFAAQGSVGEAVVVYRLGVLYHLLCTGKLPVEVLDNLDDAQAWAQDPNFELSDRLTESGRELFHKTFSKNPNDRFAAIDDLMLQIVSRKSSIIKQPLAGIGSIPFDS